MTIDSKVIDIETWLNTPPADEEVFSLQADGTGKYIPYEIVIDKLYQLCGHDWSCYNLHVTYVNLPDKRTLISGTIEVEVNYVLHEAENKSLSHVIKRRLSGGANFICNSSKIPHTTASVRSLAVMSTVKVLGKQFGWQLNVGEEPTPQELYNPEAAKQKEIVGFIEAIKEASSLKAVYIFKKTVDREKNNELSEAYALRIKELSKLPKIKKQKIELP